MSTPKEEPMEKVIEDLMTSVKATADYLAFLENIGHHAFRRQLKMTEVELSDYISKQNMNVMQMAREHLLAWKWINKTGRLPMFEAYRVEVNEALKLTIQAEQKEEVEAIAEEQLGEAWKGEGEPA